MPTKFQPLTPLDSSDIKILILMNLNRWYHFFILNPRWSTCTHLKLKKIILSFLSPLSSLLSPLSLSDERWQKVWRTCAWERKTKKKKRRKEGRKGRRRWGYAYALLPTTEIIYTGGERKAGEGDTPLLETEVFRSERSEREGRREKRKREGEEEKSCRGEDAEEARETEIVFVRVKGGEEKRRRTISPIHARGNFSWVAQDVGLFNLALRSFWTN